MWARDLELALALWLVVSPFIFGHADSATGLWVNDLACGTLIGSLALASYWRPLRHIHLLELAVAGWLVGFGWMSALEDPSPASQNHILVGLLISMFAIVPSQASQPPAAWRSRPSGPRQP